MTSPEAAPRTAEFDERIREALWRFHGHDFIYGDDGEMQCNWMEHPTDFKRATMGRLLEHCDLARLLRAEAAGVGESADSRHLAGTALPSGSRFPKEADAGSQEPDGLDVERIEEWLATWKQHADFERRMEKDGSQPCDSCRAFLDAYDMLSPLVMARLAGPSASDQEADERDTLLSQPDGKVAP